MLDEPGISEGVVAAVRRTLRDAGFEADGDDDTTLASGRAADVLFDRAAERLDDPALGLTIGARIPMGALGDLDYGLCASATLREALSLVARFYGVATQRVKLRLVEQTPDASLVWERLPGIAHSRHWIEMSVAVIASRMRETLGRRDLAFSRVTFRHPSPATRAAHDAFFRTHVVFDADEDRLEFDARLLAEPLRTASRSLAELLERRMTELSPPPVADDPVLARIRQTLASMLDEGVSDLDTLARRLGESRRTLQRLLHARATSHSRLLDEIRQQRSVALLARELRVADVAAQLGFRAPSAFFRAYRRWTGTSPRRRS